MSFSNVFERLFAYEPAGTVDDFEYHDKRSVRKHHPEIDLYAAIKEK